jgi:ribonucleoside-diphosphate reductase alpha chain
MKIRGIVEALDERGLKLGGKMIHKLNIIKTVNEISPNERSQVIDGFTEFVETSSGNLYVTVSTIEERPFEILVRINSPDGGLRAACEAVGRLVSLALRSGIDIKSILEELQCIDKSFLNGAVPSIPGAIAQILIRNFVYEWKRDPEDLVYSEDCPNCNKEGALIFQGGCSTCHSCGFTDCY